MSNNQIAVQYTNSNTETPLATVAFDAFEPADQAYCTSRCLSGSDDCWAQALDTSPSFVWQICRGVRPIPPKHALRWAAVIGVSVTKISTAFTVDAA